MMRPGRWRVAYMAAGAVLLIMIAATFWLWLQNRRVEVAAFEREGIRQATGASTSPQLVSAWLMGGDALQQELIELSLVTGAQVTALTTDGEFITQSHR